MRMKLVFVMALALAACGGGKKSGDTTAPATTKPLYERLGGEDAIKAVVKDFVEVNVAKDTDDELNALVEDLETSLDTFKVPAQEQQELIAVLAPMKPSIVGQ